MIGPYHIYPDPSYFLDSSRHSGFSHLIQTGWLRVVDSPEAHTPVKRFSFRAMLETYSDHLVILVRESESHEVVASRARHFS